MQHLMRVSSCTASACLVEGVVELKELVDLLNAYVGYGEVNQLSEWYEPPLVLEFGTVCELL